MPRITNPADWCIDRLKAGRPFFAVRFNDGEHAMMYRTFPEGKVLGTNANPAMVNYELGHALNLTLGEMAYAEPSELLLGCSWGTERADDRARRFEEDVRLLKMEDFNWANEHWPLDGVVDGSTVRLLEVLKESDRRRIVVTCEALWEATLCIDSYWLPCSTEDSWNDREWIHRMATPMAKGGAVFVWAAGVGLKPTAWRLWREYSQSSHIDVGHLFNGAFGLTDYGWLQRKDGPWYDPYFRKGGFRDWVRSFLP